MSRSCLLRGHLEEFARFFSHLLQDSLTLFLAAVRNPRNQLAMARASLSRARSRLPSLRSFLLTSTGPSYAFVLYCGSHRSSRYRSLLRRSQAIVLMTVGIRGAKLQRRVLPDSTSTICTARSSFEL
jgi:hypothetical protein